MSRPARVFTRLVSFVSRRPWIDRQIPPAIPFDSQVRGFVGRGQLVRLRRPIDREQFLDCVSGNEKNSRPFLPRTHVKRSALAEREEETVQLRAAGRTITRFDYWERALFLRPRRLRNRC